MEEKVNVLSTSFLNELYQEWLKDFSDKNHTEFIFFLDEKYPKEVLSKHFLTGENGVFINKTIVEKLNNLAMDELASQLDLKASKLLFLGNGNGPGIYQKDKEGNKIPLDMIYATDTRLWNYLSLFVFGKYMSNRWGERKDVKRIFINNLGNEKVSRHGIMRLYWSAQICFDNNLDNGLELLEVFWKTADFFTQVTERLESSMRVHTQWFLEFCKDPDNNFKLFNETSDEGLIKYRKLLKLYNSLGSVYIYEDTGKTQFNNILNKLLEDC